MKRLFDLPGERGSHEEDAMWSVDAASVRAARGSEVQLALQIAPGRARRSNGQQLKSLTVVDEYAWECLAMEWLKDRIEPFHGGQWSEECRQIGPE